MIKLFKCWLRLKTYKLIWRFKRKFRPQKHRPYGLAFLNKVK